MKEYVLVICQGLMKFASTMRLIDVLHAFGGGTGGVNFHRYFIKHCSKITITLSLSFG
jgi:hypothetical protein